MIWLFTYGLLADAEQMRNVVGHVPGRRAASITGYRREFSSALGYHYLVPDPDGRVAGVAWRLPESMLPEVDDFEDVGEGLYRRVPVEVALDGNGRVPGYAYVGGTIADADGGPA